MFKKKEKNPLDGLHGQDLVDAIHNIGYHVATEKEIREAERRAMELNRKNARWEGIKSNIGYFLKPIFFTPLAFIFHVITFLFRIIGSIACITMLYGFYCAYKAFTAWRAGEAFAENAKAAALLIVFPFIAYAIATIAEHLWDYFEDNKY